MNKWLVGLACVGMWATAAMNAKGGLIISQYYEGTGTDKWIEIYNPGPDSVDMAAGGYRLGLWSTAGRETWKTGRTNNYSAVLTNTLAAGETFLYGDSNAVSPSYAVADMVGNVVYFNGDDSIVLYTGEPYAFANVVDAIGFTNTTVAFGSDKSFVRTNTLTTGVNTDFNAAEWLTYTLANVENASPGTNPYLGYHSAGAATFGVFFDKSSGFEVEEGSSAAITATAANGTAPYGYMWTSSLGSSYYTTNAGTFTILTTAPLGVYTSTVVATDSAAQSVTNSLNFSVVAPAVKYGIAIVTNAPANGTVTTTPATEAAAGATVTVNATPAGGYAVQSIQVTGATPTGNTFIMPAQAVTVTVTFVEHTGSSLIISEVTDPSDNANAKFVELYNSGASSIDLAAGQWYLARQANGSTSSWASVALTGTVNAAQTHVVIYSASNFAAAYPAVTYQQVAGSVVTGNGNDGYFLYSGGNQTAGALEDAYGVINEDGAGKPWLYENARAARSASVTVGNPTWTASEWTITAPANAADATPGEHPDGSAVFGVTFDQTNGFTIEEGTSDVITATAANGTAPYSYAWTSSLGSSYYTTNAGAFTILTTAPIGVYTSTVVATDSAAQSVTNSLNFSVTAPAVKYGISIVTNAPANGTVTTTPATEAAAGATVTIAATPASGYAVESIVVNGGAVDVTGNTFVMPAEIATVTVTFAVHVGSSLIISEVADPSNNASAGRFVELYNAGVASVDLAAGNWFLARQSNGGATWGNIALTGTVAPGGTYVIAGSSNYPTAYPSAPAANQTSGSIDGNGNDGYFLFSGGRHTNGILEDAYGIIDQNGTGMSWEYTDRRAVRQTAVTAGNPTWTASEWTIVRANAEDMTPGVHPDGPVVFGVTFNRANGFSVEQGASNTVTATAANGTAPYTYSWSSTLGASDYTTNAGAFTILATAPIGVYTSTVVATDSGAQSVTNSINFSVTAPAVKYGISIVTNAPANGTVTTTPATEAAAGATVTVNATPAGGYAVESIVVNGGAVSVNGTTFTMPAAPATVTVTFMVYEAPDALIDFETYAGSYAMTNYVAGGVTWTMTNAFAGNTVDDRKNGTKAARLENNRGGAGHPAAMTSTAFGQPVTKISFWYANYGVNDGGKFKVQVSDDGATWQDVGEAEYDPITNAALAKATIETIPASMTYVQFVTTAGTAQRVNIDDIGIFFGVPTFSVSLNRANGFTVNQGSSDAITATAANGTLPYGYSWGTTMSSGYSTNGNVFSILATAPTGSYSATVTATDSTLATAQKTVTFSVVGVNPDEPAVVISGSQSGTVGVEMALTISITNETANDWEIILKDPDGLDADWDYSNFPPTFSLTPAKAGTYVLTATALTGSGNYSNHVNLTVSGGGSNHWAIGSSGDGSAMFTTLTNITIVLPTNYTLNAVYGSDANGTGLNNLGQGLGTLNPGVDYTWTPATRTINILSTVTNRRFIRIGATP